MKLKPGVKLANVAPELVLALTVCDGVYVAQTGREMTVTSLGDGAHSTSSKHYPRNNPDGKVRAADLRIKDIERAFWVILAGRIRTALGVEFDVVLETHSLGNEHIHVEFDPK